MRIAFVIACLSALVACSSGRPQLPTAQGPWTHMNGDKWASTDNAITDAPPRSGIRQH